MENDTLRQLFERKSVRAFTDQPIEEPAVNGAALVTYISS